MDVRYERPMPDLSHTITAPLVLDFCGRHGVCIERWSLDGLQAPDALRGLSGPGWLTIPFQGFGITFRVQLRHDADSGLLRFETLGPREGRVLRHFYRALVTGRAVAMDRMITAMDTPVELVPMVQTPQEQLAEAQRTRPRLARVAVAVLAYAVLAVLAYGPIVQAFAGGAAEPVSAPAPVEIAGQ